MVEYNGEMYRYVHSLQGDVVGILDDDGNLVVEYKYDAWGKPITIYPEPSKQNTLGAHNPFRYRGYVWDRKNEFYYIQTRYYSSAINRFVAFDKKVNMGSIAGGANLYCYCDNNVVEKIDPDGCTGKSVAEPHKKKKTIFERLGEWMLYKHFEGREIANGRHPSYDEVVNSDEWKLLPPELSVYHDDGEGKPELKYVTADGREAVFDSDTLEIETDPRYKATYNYVAPYVIPEKEVLWDYPKFAYYGIGHFFADMLPYYLTRNSNTREQCRYQILY